MKKDKLFITLEVLKWLFILGLPLILFFAKCTTLFGIKGGTIFVLTCSGYIFGLLVYLMAKKLLFKNYFITLNGKIINYTTQMETETDQSKIPLIENALKKCLMARDSINTIPALAVLGLVLTLFKALEKGIVSLYGLIGLALISYIIGFIIMLVQNKTIKSKNKVE